MKVLGTGTIERTEENKKCFDRRGYHMTGKTLTLGDDKSATEHVVFKGSYTRYMTVRDCGNHYIYAGYSAYYRIDKDTLEITYDVEDE